MKLNLRSTYVEEENDYENLEEAASDAARVAEIESRGANGIGMAVISDGKGSLIRVVVTQCNREPVALSEKALDSVASHHARELLKL